MIYTMSRDRKGGAARPPDRPGWSYDGPSLAPRLERVTSVRLIREHVTGGSGDAAFSWTADRGLVLTASDGRESLLLASPEYSELAAFLPAVGLYRIVVDPAAPTVPGATLKELLGYGDRDGDLQVKVEVESL